MIFNLHDFELSNVFNWGQPFSDAYETKDVEIIL